MQGASASSGASWRSKARLSGVERQVAIGVAVALVAGLIAGAYRMHHRVDRQLGSNSVGVGAPMATIGEGDELCVNSLLVPAGTRRIQLHMGPTQRPAVVAMTLRVGSGAATRVARLRYVVADVPGFQFVVLPDNFVVRHESAGQLCMRGLVGEFQTNGATTYRLWGESATTLNGKLQPPPLDMTEPAVHFYTAADDRPRRWQLLPAVLERVWVWSGKWYAWLAVVATLAALFAIGYTLWLLITSQRRSVSRIAVSLGVVGFVMSAWWATAAPTFQGPDEPEHYAFVQYLGETGKHPTASFLYNKLPGYSSEQQQFMDAFHQNSVVVDGSVRTSWSTARVAQWSGLNRPSKRDDGGGYTIAATGHSSLYYAPLAAAYRVVAGLATPDQVLVLRLLSALLAGLIPFLTVLSAATLFAGRKLPAAAAGTLAALHPMAGHIGGSINNDTAINVTGALILLLVVKIAIEGWTTRRAVSLGVTAVAAPILKLSGGPQSIFAALATLSILVRDRTRSALRGGLQVAGAVVGACVAWLAVATAAGQPARLVNVHTDVGATSPEWIPTLAERIDYIVQTAIPSIHLIADQQPISVPLWRIYGVGGWATFGWTRINFTIPVYKVLALIWVVSVVCGLIAIARHRGWVRRNWLPLLFVLGYPVLIVSAVGWAYAVPGGRTALAEQGRYILPALSALCVAMAGSVFGLPRKLREYGWGIIGGFIAVFTIASATLALGGWYT